MGSLFTSDLILDVIVIVVWSHNVALRHPDVAFTMHNVKSEWQLGDEKRAIITLGCPERDPMYSWSSRSLDRIGTKEKAIPVNDLNYRDMSYHIFEIA